LSLKYVSIIFHDIGSIMYIIYIGYFYNLIAYLQLDYTMVVCTQLYYFNIITPKIINKKMNGRRTKNQETLLYPSLQIR